MRHRKCKYCGVIGHEPEMNKYIDPEYISRCYGEITKYGIVWAHEKCFLQRIHEWRREA